MGIHTQSIREQIATHKTNGDVVARYETEQVDALVQWAENIRRKVLGALSPTELRFFTFEGGVILDPKMVDDLRKTALRMPK